MREGIAWPWPALGSPLCHVGCYSHRGSVATYSGEAAHQGPVTSVQYVPSVATYTLRVAPVLTPMLLAPQLSPHGRQPAAVVVSRLEREAVEPIVTGV